MSKITISIFILFVLMCGSLFGTAPDLNGKYRFSVVPFVGYHSGYEFGRLVPLPHTRDVPEITVLLENRGIRLGLSLGYRVTEHIEIQGMFVYGLSEIQNDIGIGLAGIPLGIVKISDAKAYSYSGNAVYHFPFNFISFFVKAGIGATTLKPDQLRTRTKFQLNFGAGTRINLGKRFHILFEAMDIMDFFDYARDFELIYVTIYSEDFKKLQHRFGIHLGLGCAF